MFITGYAFAKCILMLYSLFRFFLQQNDFFEIQFLIRIAWEAVYISNMVGIIYISSVLTDEVMSPISHLKKKMKI